MSKRRPWAAPVMALALAMLSGTTAARADGDYAPAKAEKTLKNLDWLCWTGSLCPLTAKNYETFKRSVDGHRDDRYLLGLLLILATVFRRTATAAWRGSRWRRSRARRWR